ncbi:polysaccharide biosynthesis tyrosine autokinase [Psychroflexus sp. YR1-1]|uniref:non-specific protein-tyrosine kinase n=1 Tax=Psychroflexus aurantiacus TaxID=2709310 RepID=A0A6B3RA37_9FLAO|nr:polysaccharide biosynthesis tyrosine autokinase [Psychroflexus aurantiacus]NEV94424.1 polysaccharide biosynthesis tyrosine autokinase [Psychroflexus aurantiacus]
MENPNTTHINSTQEDNTEDLKKIVLQYLKYWPWFLVCIVISVAVAFIYLRYTSNVYQTNAQIKVLKEQSGLDLTGLEGAAPLLDMSKVNLENEKEILNSRRLAKKVVENLELSKRYFLSGNFKSSELWGDERPFTISWIDKEFVPESDSIASYAIEFESLSEFEIRNKETEVSKKYTVGEPMLIDGYPMMLNFNPRFEGDITQLAGNEYAFSYVSTPKAVTSLTKQLTVEPLGDRSEILDVSIQGQNESKNEAILNSLIEQFNSDGVEDNRLIAKSTEEFVIKRLNYLVDELDTVESGLANFKSKNDLVEIENNAEVLFTKSTQAELRVYEISTQLSLTKNFKEELLEQEEYDLLPARIGIDNDNINSFTETYNDKILERERLLISSTNENPALIELNKIIKQLRNNILNTINNYIKSLEISLSEVKRREQEFDINIGQLPEQEKQIRIIRRQQEVKERLYLFLLQKREEAALSYAITSPIIKVVDFPYTQPEPVSPKSSIILLASLIIGLVVPFGILYIFFLFDTKIKSKDQIKAFLPNLPVVAEVPQYKGKENKIIMPNDRSSVAEAFRIMRTNLNFMNLGKDEASASNSEVVFVTSTTKGEGKTFVAINLASSLVAAKKKTLLIGCDIRNPQVHNYLNLSKDKLGVTNYLYDNSITAKDIIIKDSVEGLNLDVILSGDIPPNPAEMLMTSRFSELLEEAKQTYDYIIVDTAPTILVTDTILISKYADTTLYIMRSGYTDTRLLPHVRDIYEQKKLNNMGVVINGLDESGINAYNYGYGYGYGESQEKKRAWKFW